MHGRPALEIYNPHLADALYVLKRDVLSITDSKYVFFSSIQPFSRSPRAFVFGGGLKLGSQCLEQDIQRCEN